MKCPEELLALSAAGLLDACEERIVRQHARECPACAARLAEFADLAAGLRQLPMPVAPPHLMAQVPRRMAEYADARQAAWIAASVSVLAWTTAVAGWYFLRQVSDQAAWIWIVWSAASAITALPVTVGLLHKQRSGA